MEGGSGPIRAWGMLQSQRRRAGQWLELVKTSSWLTALADSLLAFGATRLLILSIFIASAAIVPAKNSTQIPFAWPDFDRLLSQGDGGWYLDLAAHGYDSGPFASDRQANWTFFPLYSMSIRPFIELGAGDGAIAGILLSNVFSVAGLVFLWRLSEGVAGSAAARRTVFYLSAFPTSVFLSGVWNMGLAFLLMTGCLYLLLRQRWAASSLAGGLAVATRGQAVFVLAALGWALLTMRRNWPSRLRAAPYLLAVPIPLGAFMLFMWRLTGNPLAFWDVQEAWGRELSVPWRVFGSFLLHPRLVGQGESAWDFTAMNVAVAAVSLAMLPFVFRAFGGVIGWYTAATVLPLLPFSTLQAFDRYVLLAFPLFTLLAVWGEREWVDRLVTVVFLGLLGLWATLFASGYFPVLA